MPYWNLANWVSYLLHVLTGIQLYFDIDQPRRDKLVLSSLGCETIPECTFYADVTGIGVSALESITKMPEKNEKWEEEKGSERGRQYILSK